MPLHQRAPPRPSHDLRPARESAPLSPQDAYRILFPPGNNSDNSNDNDKSNHSNSSNNSNDSNNKVSPRRRPRMPTGAR